ncbi:MAG: hypothetical protein NZM11_10805, partial [Anaerolineales bacterium]|nr:hypothetical protein [Anaerolineales bacterium]
GLTNFSVVNGVVDLIWVLPRGTEVRYTSPQFLKTFGRFEQAWIVVDADYDLFQLLLYYPDKGITALYEGPAVKDNSNYELCLEGVGPELWLWSPGKVFMPDGYQFTGPDFGLGPGGHEELMRTIEAAGFAPDAIIESFGNPSPGCLTTPRDLWEAP